MRRAWAIWAVKRVVVPVGWYASVVFGLRAAMPGPWAEFAAGAAVLIVWAVVADWPGSTPRG